MGCESINELLVEGFEIEGQTYGKAIKVDDTNNWYAMKMREACAMMRRGQPSPALRGSQLRSPAPHYLKDCLFHPPNQPAFAIRTPAFFELTAGFLFK